MKKQLVYIVISLISIYLAAPACQNNQNDPYALGDTVAVVFQHQQWADSIDQDQNAVDKSDETLVDKSLDYRLGQNGELLRMHFKKGQNSTIFYLHAGELALAVEEGVQKFFFHHKKLYCMQSTRGGQTIVEAPDPDYESLYLANFAEAYELFQIAVSRPVEQPDTPLEESTAEMPEAPNFTGLYVWESEEKNDGTAAAAFHLKIEQNGDKLSGGYNAYTNYGNKADQGEDEYSCQVSGTVVFDGDFWRSTLQYTSCYSGEQGTAEFLYSEGTWHWRITKDAGGWAPAEVVLNKK